MLMMITSWWQCWKLRHDERAVTAIEYGLIAALVAAVIVTAVGLVGTNLEAVFNAVAGKLTVPPG